MTIRQIQLPIFNGIFFFTLAVAIGLSVVVSLSVYFQVSRSIGVLQENAREHGINELQNSMETFLNTRLTVLADHATLSIISQATMQPDSTKADLVDFMDGVQLLGKKSQLVLLDYQGQVINATESAPVFNYSKENWVKDIVLGEKQHYLAISRQGNRFFWRLAVPVRYNQHPEGVLVAEIMAEDANFFRNVGAEIEDYQIDLLYENSVFTTLGPDIYGKSKELPMSIPGFSARYRWDNKELNKARYTLILEVTLGILLTVVVSLLVALFLADRFFIKPLRQLRSQASKFSEKAEYGRIPTKQRIEEIAYLAKDFNKMMDQVHQREDELIAARTNLEMRVEERTTELSQSKEELKDLNENLEMQIRKRTRELKQTQSKLVMQEKMASVGQLAAGIAHELNNPINFVRTNFATLTDNFTDLLEVLDKHAELIDTLEIKAEMRSLVAEVREVEETMNIAFLIGDIPVLFEETQHGFERIAKIISSMLDFSRSDQIGELGWASINKGLEDTLVISRNEYKYHVDVSTDFGELDDIKCSLHQLNQVFLNIIVNSAQAIAAGTNKTIGKIAIKTWQDQTHVYCQFSDNGPGISEKYQSRIFEPFFTTKDPGKGTGLGLSISYDIIVQKHGGTIEVNCPDGGGSIFTISLPK